jgi:hypothetical protein
VGMGGELLQWRVFRDAMTAFDNNLGRFECAWSAFGKLMEFPPNVLMLACVLMGRQYR